VLEEVRARVEALRTERVVAHIDRRERLALRQRRAQCAEDLG
jgi:hypothetical protein